MKARYLETAFLTFINSFTDIFTKFPPWLFYKLDFELIFFFSESNAGSVTHLVTNEQPLAIGTALPLTLPRPLENPQHYKSQPSLNHSPIYNNMIGSNTLVKTQSFADNLNSTGRKPAELNDTSINVENLQLDPIVLRESHLMADNMVVVVKRKYPDLKLDNDLTVQEKENSLLSASRLRLLQDTTMIESALDLDSLDDSSLGTNSQAGLMKVIIWNVRHDIVA